MTVKTTVILGSFTNFINALGAFRQLEGKHGGPGGLNNKRLFFTGPEAGKSEVKQGVG